MYDLGLVLGTKSPATAYGINQAGQIVANSGVLLTPAPGGLDLAVRDVSSPIYSVTAGDTVSYNGQVLNLGGIVANKVTVVTGVDPRGVKVESATIRGGSCNLGSNPITCTVDQLAGGGTAEYAIVGQAIQSFSAKASVSAAEADVNPVNDQFNEYLSVTQVEADLSAGITATPNPVRRGQALKYAVAARNNSRSITARNVRLSYQLPGKVSLQSVTPSQGQCTVSSGSVSCQFGDLAYQATATVTIQVTAPNSRGTLSSSATVTSDVPDPNPSNNSFSSSVVVVR